jgi:hypothetical protein
MTLKLALRRSTRRKGEPSLSFSWNYIHIMLYVPMKSHSLVGSPMLQSPQEPTLSPSNFLSLSFKARYPRHVLFQRKRLCRGPLSARSHSRCTPKAMIFISNRSVLQIIQACNVKHSFSTRMNRINANRIS